MSKKNSAAERDALLAQMVEMSTKPDSPGSKQAQKAVEKKAEKESAVTPRVNIEEPTPISKKTVTPKASVVASSSTTSSKRNVEREKAEKVSVSLHPVDQERAEHIEDALRKAKLIGRRAPTSFILKIALAAFDASRIENLAELVDEVKAQDGRGKWMKAAK